MASQLQTHFPFYYFLLILSLVLTMVAARVDEPILSLPGCNYTCGDVIIPYPFGFGPSCARDHWFEVECRPNSNGSTKPFLSKFHDIEVMEVDIYFELTVSIPPMNSCRADNHQQQLNGIDLRKSPYSYSTNNVFVVEGCPLSAILMDKEQHIMAGCGTVCQRNNTAIPSGSCYGVNCCQTPISLRDYTSGTGFQFYQIDFNGQLSDEPGNCSFATIIDGDYMYDGMSLRSNPPSTGFPVVLEWSWLDKFKTNNPRVQCTSYPGDCKCKESYYGNPYLQNGCQVPEKCKECRGYCYGEWDLTGNLLSYSTSTCEKKPVLDLASFLGLTISCGIVILVVVIYGLYRFVKRRREIRRKARFFKRNGGLLLQQQLSSSKGKVESTRIFSMAELDKATDHFNENRILGQGGQGTVYKGMLSDGRIVAIKKAKLLDESQLEQFINEVVILSQINHRNVVKLLGCCLETEVPLLVYEFVSNGTLFEHIHDPDEDFIISWELCLRIASESAAAVAYLHSSASTPIYHRDIKSSNILLDEKNRAKVSDFGSSKTIAIDQTHMTTLVQGTMGYLDPEYFQSYQFTEKSDVYSFGVVLLEILTAKKPIYRDACTMEQKNLVTEFMFMAQNSRLFEMVDPKIVREANEDELTAILELTKRCISWSGKLRPTMKEVAMTLEMIIKSPAQVSRWYQEQEPFPIVVDEYSMNDVSDTEFSSNIIPTDFCSPPFVDEHPLLPDTK